MKSGLILDFIILIQTLNGFSGQKLMHNRKRCKGGNTFKLVQKFKILVVKTFDISSFFSTRCEVCSEWP